MSGFSLELPTFAELPHWPNPMKVTVASPSWGREATSLLGLYFNREFHFDFPLMEAGERSGAPGFQPYEVYLFHQMAHDLLEEDEPVQHRAFGACGFRWVDRGEGKAGWCQTS